MNRVVPAEWAPHSAMWVGFPSHPDLWEDDLEPARREVADLVRVLAGEGGERVRLLVADDDAAKAARALLGAVPGVEFAQAPFGDIWLRDTGPIFVGDAGRPLAVGFRFNGWGGKYRLAHDDGVAARIAEFADAPLEQVAAVLEGGALDHDGQGTVLTTRQCLLNPNRNKGWTESGAEAVLAAALGARKVIWLDDGLMNDHTDGHVDNLARFVAPGVVACPVAYGSDDPNADVYEAAAAALAAATDARGAKLDVVRVPSPGRVAADGGDVVPASHMNFLIANRAVVVPIYRDLPGALALESLREAFPTRTVVGLASQAILTGGGSFHCITQQEPAL